MGNWKKKVLNDQPLEEMNKLNNYPNKPHVIFFFFYIPGIVVCTYDSDAQKGETGT